MCLCVAKAPNQGCERALVFQNTATCGRLRAAADCPLYCAAMSDETPRAAGGCSQQVVFQTHTHLFNPPAQRRLPLD